MKERMPQASSRARDPYTMPETACLLIYTANSPVWISFPSLLATQFAVDQDFRLSQGLHPCDIQVIAWARACQK
jgi:hypothetical protein